MNAAIAKDLLDALGAWRGIVAAIGAGGKKSTLIRLLEAHRALGTKRILLTSTVQIAAPRTAIGVEPQSLESEGVASMIGQSLEREAVMMLAGPERGQGRFCGLPQDRIAGLHREGRFDVSLVKADGARMRMIKGPKEGEPALPVGVDLVLPIVAARAIGRPLDDKTAFRPERFATIVDLAIGEPIRPVHVARLLASENGALKGADDARVMPVINMVDAPDRLASAREAARAALAMTDRFDRVALAAMARAEPLIEIVDR
jgi:probable selenium-dependent hydroxylase accessory protein YqeC